MELLKEISFSGFSSKVSFIAKEEILAYDPQLIVVDENTKDLFPLDSQWEDRVIVLPSGEESKHLDSIVRILKKALELGLDRKSLIMGIGGGVITDMTAFAASLYMRGCPVILLPTTLLAMVDAAIGGKTGVDFQEYKNMVGSFYPAQEVLICPEVLSSLADREYYSGMAEAIKTAWLGDRELHQLFLEHSDPLKQRDPQLLREVIRHCVEVKGRIVEEDLKEGGIRAWLNLGHTFGHALETASGFSLVSHGEAVAWGIACALDTAKKLQDIDESFYTQAMEMLTEWGYRLKLQVDPEKVFQAMFQDKKKQKGELRFVLLKGLVQPWVGPVDHDCIKEVLFQRLEA